MKLLSVATPLLALGIAALVVPAMQGGQQPAASEKPKVHTNGPDMSRHPAFRTSDRCVACHNGIHMSNGKMLDFGLDWEASVMANAGRDPYWQGSVRRETLDHPMATADIQDECSTCHMPVQHLEDHLAGRKTQVFSYLPLHSFPHGNRAATDGVSCSVCHQIEPEGLGTKDTFNGDVVVAKLVHGTLRPEYGPYVPTSGHQTVMQSSTGAFQPQQGMQIREAGLCGSCHTLYTKALGPDGKQIGTLPEQMPYLEWEHSDYNGKQTCQHCHMPEVKQPVAITALYGQKREGVRRHVFVGGNFFLQTVLNDHRGELGVDAPTADLNAAIKRTDDFLRTQSAKVTVGALEPSTRGVAFEVKVQNLSGHKLPTAYPSRRVWLHVIVRNAANRVVFESGALNPDGSIVGNINDQDPSRYEPHYTEITRPDEVEIYEPILHDAQGHVTTGLLSATGYLKDNRLLPAGFDKATAVHDIEVKGRAADDPHFVGGSSTVRYDVPVPAGAGPVHVTAELWYQPVGFRWAHNLAPYHAAEPQRMVHYFDEMGARTATLITSASR